MASTYHKIVVVFPVNVGVDPVVVPCANLKEALEKASSLRRLMPSPSVLISLVESSEKTLTLH